MKGSRGKTPTQGAPLIEMYWRGITILHLQRQLVCGHKQGRETMMKNITRGITKGLLGMEGMIMKIMDIMIVLIMTMEDQVMIQTMNKATGEMVVGEGVNLGTVNGTEET